MDKKKRTRIIKLVSATSMAIFSLFVSISGAFAWFNAERNVSNYTNNFDVHNTGDSITKITVHDFYGLVDNYTSGSGVCDFGFSTSKSHEITWSEGSGTDDGGFQMGTYSVDNPHHPVLILFETNGNATDIRLTTTLNYITDSKAKFGGENLDAAFIKASYAALNVPANKIAANDGLYFEVTADEHQGIYYKNETNDDVYVTTRYQYDHVKEEFIIVWADLGQFNNPLSSIVKTNYVLYTDDPTDNSGDDTYDTNGYFLASGNAVGGTTYYTRTGEYGSYVYTADGSISSGDALGNTHYIKKDSYIKINSVFDNESQTFVTFPNGVARFNHTIDAYTGSPTGKSHIGIVIDYNPESLEFIYSYFLGHRFLNSGLNFKCDWTMEI